jgi:Cellulase (glycosyl hydrolase family 5)
MQGIFSLCLLALLSTVPAVADPLSLDSKNPHYFLFRGKPTILVTSGEHYGAVINKRFDYVRYLEELSRNHLNLTRIWSGPYREVAGNFNISDNVLAPDPAGFLPPWPRSDTPGAADGGNRFDLKQWNPAYFERLRDFIEQASRRGIVVEVNLFCPYYEDSMWQVSPLNSANNVNGVGNVPRVTALTMDNRDLLAVEDAMVQKIVTELNGFDNIYYEICNEPYFGGVTLEWQHHIAETIQAVERALPARHLISQNISNGSKLVENPDANVSIFNFHYSRPPSSVAMNYGLNRVIGNNETGFDGQSDSTYRIQGWDFLAAGGALYNNLDYSFTVGHESGDFHYSAATPGGGSAQLRDQLGILKTVFESLPLEQMHAYDDAAKLSSAGQATVRVLASTDDYLIYIHQARIQPGSKPSYVIDSAPKHTNLSLTLPSGRYRQLWLNTKTGDGQGKTTFVHGGGERSFESPVYSEDIALRLQSVH